MIRFTKGNLLEADVEAVVNTVNCVGVMGKGIALMFKERYPTNFKAYEAACKRDEVQIGRMFVTESDELAGPRWIVNFPTKKHWRGKSKMEWIEAGLDDLKRVIVEKGIRSIAIPPLGSGNGGLEWADVRSKIKASLAELDDVDVVVYEPTRTYQSVAKNVGVEKLTPARAMIAEMVRRYSILGLDCSILEVQKLAWFLERVIERRKLTNPLNLKFTADRYGPYAHRLTHLLNALDGSFLHCEKRLADASPLDTIDFNDESQEAIERYLRSPEGAPFVEVIEATEGIIEGFQSPLGMEVLATVDWLLIHQGVEPTLYGVRQALRQWPGGSTAAERKERVFSDKLIQSSLDRLEAL